MFELILVFEEKFHLILLLKSMKSYFNKGIKLIEQKNYLKEKSFLKKLFIQKVRRKYYIK